MGRVKRVRSPRVSKGARSHSALRDRVWAVISDERTITGLTHRKAFQIAKELRGVVTTQTAANRQQ